MNECIFTTIHCIKKKKNILKMNCRLLISEKLVVDQKKKKHYNILPLYFFYEVRDDYLARILEIFFFLFKSKILFFATKGIKRKRKNETIIKNIGRYNFFVMTQQF